MRNFFKFLLVILVLSVCFLPGWSLAVQNQTPMQVEADHMLSVQKNNSVFFSGKVEAKQDGMIIHCDEMTIFYSQADAGVKKKSKQQKKVKTENSKNIEKMYAKGKVEITQVDWVSTSDIAEYYAGERKLILIGNTKVWQDNNMVTGDRFVIFLDEGKSIVDRSKKKGERVKAFFYPKGEGEGK